MRRAPLAGVAASLFAAATASAEPPADISWNTPPGSPCPEQRTVVAEVERLLGSGRDTPREPLRAVADVSQDAGGQWHVTIVAGYGGSDARDTRELYAPTCGTVAGATALVIAMMIEPLMIGDVAPADLGSGTPAPRPVVPPPLPAPALPAPMPVLSPPPPAPEEPLPTFLLAARLGGNVGVVPVPALALGADIGGMLERVRFDLGVSYIAPREVLAEDHPTAGVDVSLLLVHVTGTFLQWREPLEIGWQLGLDVGSIRGEGFGVRQPASEGAAWVAPRLGVLAAYPIGEHFAIRANVAFSYAGIRPTFRIAGVGDVYALGGPVGDLALAAELRL